MSEKTQIEEMDDRANDCCKCGHHLVCYKIKQYNIQQRYTGLYCPSFEPKQSKAEWISVEERLPEKAGRYLVYGVIGGQPLVCGAHYDKHNGFGDNDFTHWMPLPEPPKPER